MGGIGVAIPVLVGGVLAVAETQGFDFDSVIGLGAYLPFYLYSYLQAIVIAFLVGDFRAADERAGIFEVIAARPVSTAELVAGKYLGVVGGLFTLSLGVLLLGLVIQAAKISITGTPFAIRPYLAYLLLMNLPALLYMSAVTFFLGAVLRKQSAVTLVVIAYGLAVLFFLGQRYGGIYDFGAFFAPLFYSDLIGLGDIRRVLEIRLFYICLALFFFALSVERYPRLSQSPRWVWMGRAGALLGLIFAVGLYFSMQQNDLAAAEERAERLEVQRSFSGMDVADIVQYDMEVDFLTRGAPVRARANIEIKNGTGTVLDTLVFSLNPGLLLESLEIGGVETPWQRTASVIEVFLESGLAPDSSATVGFQYAGEIDVNGFDLLRDTGGVRLKKEGRGPPVHKGDMTAWVRSHSIFLPPRSRWYPVPGVDYGALGERSSSFFTGRIKVSVPEGLDVVTQGRPQEREVANGRAAITWTLTREVSVLSITAGEYEVFEAKLHGIDCALYIHPAHRKQILFFEDAKEEALRTLDQILDSVEQETGLEYPYERLSVVEVPFQVQWYYEGWEESGGLSQPGVLMVEEDMLMGLGLNRRLKWMMRRQGGDADPARIKRDLLVNSVFDLFLAEESSRGGIYRSPVLQLWSFDRSFAGKDASLLERGLPLYLQKDLNTSLRESLFESSRGRFGGRFRRPSGAEDASWDTLVSQMQRRSFADLDPEEDAELYRAVVDAKGPALFQMVEAVLGEKQFRSVLDEFEDDSRYQNVEFSSFERAAIADTTDSKGNGANLQRLIQEWLHGTHVPGYSLTQVKAYKVDDGWGMVVYQVIVRIRNGEPGRGFVQVRAMGGSDESVKGVEIEGGQEVEVGLILWERPVRVSVEPFFARNRRTLMAPLRIAEQPMEGRARSYVREVSPDETPVTEIVVDDEDEGYSMPIRRVQRFLRPELKGDNWSERQIPFAYGRYENGFHWKRPGDGAQPAVWTTRLPHSG
ncbi:MAG: hypothetical protein O2954_07310, partial [bacterium]|nr:hypothetical protein [bacterium]